MKPRSYTVQGSSGLALCVLEWGPEDGQPVVMLHGIRGYAQTFATLARSLAPHFRTIAYDQRGRGESDWDPQRQYYTDAYVRDLEEVARQLHLGRFDLLGHSMGGIAAIVYAAVNPGRVRRLVIEDAGPGAFEASAGAARIRQELASAPTSFESWDAAVEFMRQLRPMVTPSAREERLRNMLKQEEATGIWTWRYDHAGIAEVRLNPDPAYVVDLWPHVEAITCATLILRGARSDYLGRATVEEMARRNPNLEWREIADAGHYVHDDQPEAVARWVGSFLLRSGNPAN
jgi:pimeloyl-ACP methyl ester carboxylesterase